MNVLLITLDAFRKDLVSGSHTPYLSKISKEGVTFDNAISTGSGTSSSFPGILASSLPMDYGYAKFRPEHVTLAEQLDSTTIGISSSLPTSSIYNFNRGFNRWNDNVDNSYLGEIRKVIRENDWLLRLGEKAIKIGEKMFDSDNSPSYTPANEVTDTALSELNKCNKNDNFLWAHYMETHTPYFPPEEFQFGSPSEGIPTVNKHIDSYNKNKPKVNSPTTPEDTSSIIPKSVRSSMEKYYKSEAKFLDREIKRLVEGAKRHLEEVTVIICADHGEEFFEHGHFGHQPKLYEELVNVPLIVYSTSSDIAEKNIRRPTSLLNIPPTVCDLLDRAPADNWRGESLLSILDEGRSDENPKVISELCHSADQGLGGPINRDKAIISVRSDEWKYILNNQIEKDRLYNLKKDEKEKENVVDDHPEIGDKLRRIAEDRLAEITNDSDSESSNGDISDNVEDRLEELGYINS
ncbi:sulfatase [Haloterrigena salina JCM 13891]|uniref:Sulfatase n=1 Tax=Haloterrigena salina JCM 13891 TaxID=1227488 RepID=M0BST8_9EURY|nr:sulfatase-like hydrolase/transferase [Haloterrigena salina]ELZ14076.1 sulfatase [Haloterrigena salina JCM 13891]